MYRLAPNTRFISIVHGRPPDRGAGARMLRQTTQVANVGYAQESAMRKTGSHQKVLQDIT